MTQDEKSIGVRSDLVVLDGDVPVGKARPEFFDSVVGVVDGYGLLVGLDARDEFGERHHLNLSPYLRDMYVLPGTTSYPSIHSFSGLDG